MDGYFETLADMIRYFTEDEIVPPPNKKRKEYQQQISPTTLPNALSPINHENKTVFLNLSVIDKKINKIIEKNFYGDGIDCGYGQYALIDERK